MVVRRISARRKLWKHQDVWPINPAAGKTPDGWPGWPDGKKFAVVLTHDVEGSIGLAKCQQLMQLEQELGFRSSFNLIPEGDEYIASRQLRDTLVQNGFEVGVHDLYHNGKLLWTREDFRRSASQINRYLKDWDACGFRAGFMLRNLDWFHDLNIQYDASTFDTDPFEPQPDGANTIFPFWVPRPVNSENRESRIVNRESEGGNRASGHQPDSRQSQISNLKSPSSESLDPKLQPSSFSLHPSGYAELPYTLCQDSTLFLVFKQTSIDIWKRKIDWIAERGGMVLLNTHPDYMNFNRGSHAAYEYPVSHYREVLDYIREKYSNQFWNVLPRTVAEYVKTRRIGSIQTHSNLLEQKMPSNATDRKKIWIDLDNTPHVPFFEPIIAELERRGHSVLLTARDAFQVCDLADRKGIKYLKIGRHHGKNKLIKVLGLFYRASQLLPTILAERPALAVSHGARSQIIAANLLRIPTVLLTDYEFAKALPLMRPTWEIVPEVISDEGLYCRKERIRKYPGIKEDVYVPSFRPDPAILSELGLKDGELIITVRPPATEAHYHNPEAEILFTHFMNRATKIPNTRMVLLPRNHKQDEVIRHQSPEWFLHDKTVVPKRAVDGLNLLWHSDLVVSGGGTMNREAAALGIPVYSIFRGPIGAVDHFLERTNRLVLIENTEQVDSKIILAKRDCKLVGRGNDRSMISIVEHIEEILKVHYPPSPRA